MVRGNSQNNEKVALFGESRPGLPVAGRRWAKKGKVAQKVGSRPATLGSQGGPPVAGRLAP